MNIEQKDAHGWFCLGNEYLDFIEFLQNELGFEEVKELMDKFQKQADTDNNAAYQKFKNN